jgi:hypothetical protein
MESLAEVALQNLRGLDILTVVTGSLCTTLHETCCMYINSRGLVEENLTKTKANLYLIDEFKEQTGVWENWFHNLFS